MGNPVRVAVVGLGGRGYWAAQTAHESPEFKLVGVCDIKRGKVDRVAAKLQDPAVALFDDYARCLKERDFKAVIVCTDDGRHADVAVPSLEAGKFVYVEKPIEIASDQCRAIADADEKAGLRAFVGLNLRYAPVYAKIHEMIRAGSVGEVLTIEANEFYKGGRTYFRRWNRLRSRGGGLWITKACHDFDLLYWMAGSKPVSVCAFNELSYYKERDDAPLYCLDCNKKFTCPDSKYLGMKPEELPKEADIAEDRAESGVSDLCLWNSDKDTFDHGTALVRFENGATACYTCNVVSSLSNRLMRVSGTKGCLDGDLGDQKVIYRKRYADDVDVIDTSKTARGGHGGADLNILESFADFVRGADVPTVRPPEASVSVALGLAATLSADEGRVVSMDEIRGDGSPTV